MKLFNCFCLREWTFLLILASALVTSHMIGSSRIAASVDRNTEILQEFSKQVKEANLQMDKNSKLIIELKKLNREE